MWFRHKIRRQHVAVALLIAFASILIGGLWYMAVSFKSGMHEYYQRLNAR
jgi:uncharacterized protein YdgA (DUF945 family)